MKVVILCGGQGMRIRDVSEDLPKPLIPVGDRPILWHIMKTYAKAGHRHFVLCLGYKGFAIKDFFLNYRAQVSDFTLELGAGNAPRYHDDQSDAQWAVTCAETGLDSLTGTRVKRIARYIDEGDDFLLTYGDGVSDVDIGKLIAFHRSHGRIMTVTGVRPPGRYGELLTGPGGTVREFNEKPQAAGGLISGGFFVCRRELFDYLPDDRNVMLEEEPMRALVKDDQIRVFEHQGFWQCMDTYRDFRLLNNLWEKGTPPWKTW